MSSLSQVKQNAEKAACTELRYTITHADLPLSCPPRDDRIWDAHPRIYLPIEQLGKVTCPYCGAQYTLQDFVPTNER